MQDTKKIIEKSRNTLWVQLDKKKKTNSWNLTENSSQYSMSAIR